MCLKESWKKFQKKSQKQFEEKSKQGSLYGGIPEKIFVGILGKMPKIKKDFQKESR